MLREFLNRWGQRGMARGAVVVLLSGGWERGGRELLGAQMRRLRLLAHQVFSANPRKARPGYAPLAAGVAAALPSVDAFVEGPQSGGAGAAGGGGARGDRWDVR
ncbi:VWA domain-containing protein [Streptomyces sp. NPDC015171]|uniref:VWA domain-containing protein n=1 Tax=Streptomyces sp. NPDC015171 TaxID=3364945 RepID=UPI0036F75D15